MFEEPNRPAEANCRLGWASPCQGPDYLDLADSLTQVLRQFQGLSHTVLPRTQVDSIMLWPRRHCSHHQEKEGWKLKYQYPSLDVSSVSICFHLFPFCQRIPSIFRRRSELPWINMTSCWSEWLIEMLQLCRRPEREPFTTHKYYSDIGLHMENIGKRDYRYDNMENSCCVKGRCMIVE